ncbi:MAG: hypothetical protein K6G15_08985 [Desulfovibrio sp.]|nr:hypothetical protein [Desulfovibrio sp.]
MKVTYLCDEQKGAGYGCLLCSEEAFVAGSYDLCLQRAVDKCFLSPLCENAEERWTESRTVFTVSGSLSAQGELVLPLEPRIVNVLSTQDTYRLSLTSESSERPLLAQFRIASINYSAEDSLNNAQVMAGPKNPEPVVVPQQSEEAPLPSPDPVQTSAPRSGKKPLFFVLATVLLLALAGFLAWFFLWREVAVPLEPVTEQNEPAPLVTPPSEPQEAPKEEKKEAAQEEHQEEAKQGEVQPETVPDQPTEPLPQTPPEPAAPTTQAVPEPTPQPVEVPAAVTPVLSVEDQVQAFFADRERTAARAVELSQALAHNSASEQDAIFRLYYFAAEHGERHILLDYAACFDPSRPAWGTIEKDALEANRLYEQAKATLPEAQNRQKEMRNWLEEAAGRGDAQAKMWLSQLPN